MIRLAKDSLEVLLFFLLTGLLYFLFIVTIPLLRDSHGLLAMSELSDLSRSGLVLSLLFGSAVACVTSGVMLMYWVPFFTPGVMSNLWATTYFFIWIDSVFSLSLQSKSFKFLISLALGLFFIYLFFFLLNYLVIQNEKADPKSEWKIKIVHYWLWGWMGFYFGLSCFFAFHSLDYLGFRLPLAVGAMIVCFLYYLLSLFLKKSEGKDVESYSRIGRAFFLLWTLGLILIWLGPKWAV